MIDFLFRFLGRGHRRHIAVLLAIVAACVLGGGEAFAATQGRPFTTGLYWAVTTATTVGYGDVTPQNGAGRVVAALVMLTTIPLLASVFALATGSAAAAGVRRILAMHAHFPEGRYRLVIGMNEVVPAILADLSAAGVAVVLVADVDSATLPERVHLVRGDPTAEAAIAAARPADAEQALITGQSDGDVLVSSVLVRKLAPGLHATALVSSPTIREALTDLGIDQTISARGLIASTLAKSLEAPHAPDMLAQLVESNTHRLGEVPVGAAAIGKSLSAVRDERAGLVLGLVHDGKFTLGLADDPVIQSGDSLLVAEALAPAAG
ncbi:MAG TPA: potassium channel family protein [Streptosporangiaceae bacterium]